MGSYKSDIRVFRCGNCGHKMRFGARRCGNCHEDTSIWNRRGTWYAAAAFLVFLLAIIAA